MIADTKYYKFILSIFILLALPHSLLGQQGRIQQNIQSKAQVVNKNAIKLRWSPTNPKAWLDGRRYGYTVERYTMIIDSVWQQSPDKYIVDKVFKPAPLAEWEQKVQQSDYAAVVAQAFYGDDFEISSSSGDIGSIINQASELEQRFTTSLFMAEYDYQTAELAGWAWTDRDVKINEKYLYRIYLNRPNKTESDTTAIFIGLDEQKELPQPIGLSAVFGDRSVILSWNYTLLSDIYHSYHIERMSSSDASFQRITELPFTALSMEMQELFFTDSLANNDINYSYRIIGVTSFDEESPASDTISGKGAKTVSCVPHITSGFFPSKDRAKLFWEFDCKESDLVEKLQVKKSDSQSPDGVYEMLIDNISVGDREIEVDLYNETNYVKLYAINKDGSQTESFPFLVRQTDSIPPAIPAGLKVEIDTLGVAHLSWNANIEHDIRGYRILRSFTPNSEKSSLTPQLITTNYYTDTLSLSLGNTKVYYSLTAVDIRYNESEACQEVIASKPNLATPSEPIFTGYEIQGSNVSISWMVDTTRNDIQYSLVRTSPQLSKYNGTVFSGDNTVSFFTDQLPESGTYEYVVIANTKDGKKIFSPQRLILDIAVDKPQQAITNITSYTDRSNNYIQLFWAKHPQAITYRIYKAEDGKKMTLWKELDASQSRVVDEHISPDTKYTYILLFVDEAGKASQAKTITVNY